MEFVALQYFDVFHALAQAEGKTGAAIQPPFYDGLGWDGLVQSVVRLDWDCTGSTCVEQYLVEPPLGVTSRSGVGEADLPVLTLPIPPETAAGEYALWAGVYESDSQQRLSFQKLTTITVEEDG